MYKVKIFRHRSDLGAERFTNEFLSKEEVEVINVSIGCDSLTSDTVVIVLYK